MPDEKRQSIIGRDHITPTEPDHITLVGRTSRRELKLIKTIDEKGVVFYEAPLDGRPEKEK